jgi:hypothetical protein
MSELLDHPALGLIMTSAGMDRRALELLLEVSRQVHEPEAHGCGGCPFLSTQASSG